MTFKTMTICLHRALLSRKNALFFSILFARGGLYTTKNVLYTYCGRYAGFQSRDVQSTQSIYSLYSLY